MISEEALIKGLVSARQNVRGIQNFDTKRNRDLCVGTFENPTHRPRRNGARCFYARRRFRTEHPMTFVVKFATRAFTPGTIEFTKTIGRPSRAADCYRDVL